MDYEIIKEVKKNHISQRNEYVLFVER